MPSEGRRGKAPAWPLPTATARERVVWNRLWKKPQAVLWEQLGQQDIVGLYVRRFCEAEQRGSAANLSTLVKQLADYLLLTIPAMHSARVTVASDEVAAARSKKADSKPKAPSSVRDRMKAIDGGA